MRTEFMKPKVGNFAILSFIIATIVSSSACNIREMLEPKHRAENTFMLLDKGYKLSAVQAEALENTLKTNPDDYSVRVRLLAYFFRTIDTTPKETRRDTVLWLIKNKPDSEVWETNLGIINSQTDREGFEEGKTLWASQIEVNKNNPAVYYSAAHFVDLFEPAAAEDLLDKASALEPKKYEIPQEIGRCYGRLFRSADSSEDKRRLADKAIGQYEKSITMPIGASTKTTRDQASILMDLSEISFGGGYLEKAKEYSNEALRQAAADRETFDREEVFNKCNTILGLVALRDGDQQLASQYLIESGKVQRKLSPTSAGPDMSLAGELLRRGERELVIQYFHQCSGFWTEGRSALVRWEQEVRNGRVPDFEDRETS